MNILKNIFVFITFCFCGVLFSCSKKAVATVSKSDTNSTVVKNSISKYSEDLSKVRPHYSTVATSSNENKPKTSENLKSKTLEKSTIEVTDKLQIILDTIANHNKAIRSAPGYRVQIYVGESRDEALQARNKSYSIFPDETPHLMPTLPSYRVRVGDFMDRLEAQKVYKTLVKEFPNALIVPDKIEIKKFADEKAEDNK